MAFDFTLTRIDNTDTFKEWADKCNAIIDGLNATDFVTNTEGIMTLTSNQTVTGVKTFTQSTAFSGGLTSTGNYTLGGTVGVINTPTLTIRSGDSALGDGVEFEGARGIFLKSSSTSNAISLAFENAGTPEKLQFDYASTGGVFEITDGNKLGLAGSTPTITVNNYDWILPGTSPGATPSLLKWTGSGSNLSWLAESALAADIVTDVRDILQSSNFTLPVNLIPVGTMIAVDARILDSWDTVGSPAEYTVWSGAPGWIPCDGQSLSYDETASPDDIVYKELVQLLEGDTVSTSDSTTLPDTIGSPAEDPIGGNDIVYLIKYKSDDSTAFAVTTTTGSAGASGINLFDTNGTSVGSFDITGGKVGLNIDTTVFSFDGTGALTAEVDTAATADTLAKRDSAGTLTVADPTEDNHAATKSFVDRAVGEVGSVRAFPELMDGHQSHVEFSQRSMTFVDRYGRGVFSGNNKDQRSGVSGGFPIGWAYAFSPITDREASFSRTFATCYQYFFADEENGILYGSGRNLEGAIGHRDRGTGTDFADFYTQTGDGQNTIYNDQTVEEPIPAMLPQKSDWPANAVTLDTVSYTNEEQEPGLIVKTKDGVGNTYVSGDRLQGFTKYETTSGVPYTRGWLIGSSDNHKGALGTGSTAETSYLSSGPLVFGLNSAGSSLWAVFGVTDAERTTGITTTVSSTPAFKGQVNKRFHYYKRNATLAGGLGVDNSAALAAWKTELGLSGSETFDDFSYYIKKHVINGHGTWLIVGKPGNESDNELWFAGYNSIGQGGNGSTADSVARHIPALDSGTTLSLSLSTVGGTSNRVFQSSTDHGFEDFEQLSIGSSRYLIIRGDASNANLDTHFRLFPASSESAAYTALTSGGTTNGYANANIGGVINHHQKLKGIFDISVGAEHEWGAYHFILARRTTDTTTSASELDSLPESEFDSVSVMSWGRNSQGQLGIGNTSDQRTPVTVTLGTSDRPVDIVAVSTSYNTYIVTENSGTGKRSLRTAGYNGHGLTGHGLSGNTTSFTESNTINSFGSVKELFVSSGPLWQSGYTGYVFVVVESATNPDTHALFAGGFNNYGQFGGSAFMNSATSSYIRIRFPEDPKNIVSMQTNNGQSYFALCKTEEAGETAEEFAAKAGRVYGTGFASYYLGQNNNEQNHRSSWHPVDGQILST